MERGYGVARLPDDLTAPITGLLLLATPVLAGVLITWLTEPDAEAAVRRWGPRQLGNVWLGAAAAPVLFLGLVALLADGPWQRVAARAGAAAVLLAWVAAVTLTVQWVRTHPKQPPGARQGEAPEEAV